jgi:hypothetical protein
MIDIWDLTSMTGTVTIEITVSGYNDLLATLIGLGQQRLLMDNPEMLGIYFHAEGTAREKGPAPASSQRLDRCPKCRGGRIPTEEGFEYCSCQLGQDLMRVEVPRFDR